MKKCTKIIFSILLTISLILVTMSFIGENIVVKTFSQEILSKKISGYFLDEIVYDVDIEELGKIEDNVRASKYTDRITSKFIRVIVENVGNSDDIKFDSQAGMTFKEFQKQYGEPVMVYNRFDADNFVMLMQEMKDSIEDELLKADFDHLIEKIVKPFFILRFRSLPLLSPGADKKKKAI